MEIETRATLSHAAAAMRAWCHYLRHASEYRRLTSIEELVLFNAELITADIQRVLEGDHPEDQGLRTHITVERMRDESEPVLDPQGCQFAGGCG